jgi:hypothetical protein
MEKPVGRWVVEALAERARDADLSAAAVTEQSFSVLPFTAIELCGFE